MICEKCGNQIEENAKFCTFCGNKLVLPNDTPAVPETPAEPAKPASPVIPTEPDIVENPVIQAEPVTPENLNPQTETMKPDSPDIPADPPYNNQPDNNKKTSPGFKLPSFDFSKINISNKSLVITICVCTAIVVIVAAALGFKFAGNNSPDTEQDNGTTDVSYEQQITETENTPIVEINEIDSDVIDNIVLYGSDYTDYGVYVYNTKNDYEFSYNGKNEFLASAMGQVVILETLSRAIDQKDIDIENTTVRFDYIPNGKEAPHSKDQNGNYLTVKECVEDVAIYGDNNKSNLLVDYIGAIYDKDNGFDVINRMLSSEGYTGTQINRKTFINSDYIDYSVSPNMTTPADIGEMFHDLIYDSAFGNDIYMKNIFKSISNSGAAIGLKKYIPSYYEVCNVNALTSQCTNNVALIGDGETEIIVVILAETEESKTNIEDNDSREKIQAEIIEYILQTQFAN